MSILHDAVPSEWNSFSSEIVFSRLTWVQLEPAMQGSALYEKVPSILRI